MGGLNVARSYISDVTVFDGTRVRPHRGVLVDGDRITWTGPHARAPRAATDATEVDGSGRTLTPGLIDCHLHLDFDGAPDFAGEAQGLTPVVGALKGTVNARKHLAAGVTTVRDLGGVGTIELARMISDGRLPGPRVVATGRALTLDQAIATVEAAFRDSTLAELVRDPKGSTPLCEETRSRRPVAGGRA